MGLEYLYSRKNSQDPWAPRFSLQGTVHDGTVVRFQLSLFSEKASPVRRFFPKVFEQSLSALNKTISFPTLYLRLPAGTGVDLPDFRTKQGTTHLTS